MAVNIKLNDLRSIAIKDARKIKKEFRLSVKMATLDEVEKVYNSIIVNIIKKGLVESTDLLDSIYLKRLDSAGYRFELGSELEYAKYLEEGTEPHIIKASGSGVLVFETKKYQWWNNWVRNDLNPRIGRNGGFLKITPIVNHPGNKAYWFFKEAFDDNRGYFEKRLKKYLKEISL